jgi:UDP-N-acetylmuramoyl-L-alanyl-D-glutamate--2,6-diaminopimelate ligase
VARARADELILSGASLKGDPPLVALARVLAGARSVDGGRLEVVLDRRAAIARALERARRGDLVAILGRGPSAQMANDRIGDPALFDDRQVARELLERARAEPSTDRGAARAHAPPSKRPPELEHR